MPPAPDNTSDLLGWTDYSRFMSMSMTLRKYLISDAMKRETARAAAALMNGILAVFE